MKIFVCSKDKTHFRRSHKIPNSWGFCPVCKSELIETKQIKKIGLRYQCSRCVKEGNSRKLTRTELMKHFNDYPIHRLNGYRTIKPTVTA
jgi:ribosomal protein L44E